MAVHIFTVSEENYDICINRGLVGLPEPKEGRSQDNVFDGLLSRLACVRENDYILMYVIGSKELRGVWQADGSPFYDETLVWDDRVYPFRCRIKTSEFYFDKPLKLNDINDMRNNGKIWTWALQRSSGSNSMFSISNYEFEIIVLEYLKINPFSMNSRKIENPYPYRESNILSSVHTNNQALKYEYSVMTYLNHNFSSGKFKGIFGNYSDSLCYVPTSLGREMDIMLMYSHPHDKQTILSYDIIEVKRDEFDESALSQLIDYESWFLHKKISGDLNMIRTTAIAKSFSESVIEYVKKREIIENKPIKLIEYKYNGIGDFSLQII